MRKVPYIFLLIIFLPALVYADRDVVFTSGFASGTFDTCNEGQTTSGDGENACYAPIFFRYAEATDNACGTNNYTTAFAASNYSQGEGGLGIRRYHEDGVEQGGSVGPYISFNSADNVTEFWVRSYYRKSDLVSSGKIWYVFTNIQNGGQPTSIELSRMGYDALRIYTRANASGSEGLPKTGGNPNSWRPSAGLNSVHSNDWNYYELHMKMDTPNNTDGIVEWWINGQPMFRYTQGGWCVNDGRQCYWDEIQMVQSPHDSAAICGVTEDWDDFAIAIPAYTGFVQDSNGRDMIGAYSGGSSNPYVSVVAQDAVATEQGPTSGIFRLSRSNTSGNLTVSYTVAGTATGGGTDYDAIGSNATILDGNSSVDVTITAVDDAAIEGDETVIMTLVDGASYDLTGPTTATIIITDNDQTPPPPVTLVDTDFESGTAGLVSQGWYDNATGQVLVYDSVRDAADGADNGMVAEYSFAPGATTPASGSAMRLQFSDTPEIYIRFWAKISTGWSGLGYGSHMVYLLTNQNNSYSGLANTYLTTYAEFGGGTDIRTALQDARNIDLDGNGVNNDSINVDLTGNVAGNCSPSTTTNCFTQGAAQGCQGNFTNAGTGVTCYDAGLGNHLNLRWFADTVSNFADGNWHQWQFYYKMNTLTGSTVNEDGIIRMYIDDLVNPTYEATNIVFKKGWFQSQFWNQVVIGPYISGTNTTQSALTVHIDDFYVGTNNGDVVAPATSSHSPAKNANGVATNADISFDITDGGDGVNATTINVDIEGTNYGCSGQETNCTGSGAPYAYCTGSGTGNTSLTCAGSSASYTVTKGSNTFSNSQVVNIATDASDNTNAMVTDVWQFTVTAATPVPPGTAQASGSGSVSNPGGGTGYFSQTAP